MKFNKQKFSFFYRGFILIVLCMFIGVTIALKYLSYTKPMYESMAKIRLADLQEGTTGNNLFKDLDVFATKNELAAEIEVVKSQVLVEKVIDKLGLSTQLSRVGKMKTQELYTDLPFSISYTIQNEEIYDAPLAITVVNKRNYTVSSPKLGKTIKGKFNSVTNLNGFGKMELKLNAKEVNKRPKSFLVDNFELIFKSKEHAVNEAIKDLDVVLVDKEVPVMKIIYKCQIPEKTASFVNTLAQTYIEDFIDSKFKTAETTSKFLDNQIDAVKERLQATEADIQNYRDEKNVINVIQETETDLRKISQMKMQKTNVKMSLDAIEELNRYVQKGKGDFLTLAPNFEAYTDLLSTELVKKIKVLQEEKTDLLQTYSPNHPKVLAIDEKIDQKSDYIVEAIRNTRDNLETKYEKLSYDIEEAERVFIGLPEKERILHTLDRNFGLQEQSFVFLNQKRIEAEIAKSANISFHRIISSATVPEKPVSPNKTIIVIVFAILGAGGAMLIIYIVHLMKGKVNNVETIEKNTDLPVLCQAPHLENDDVDIYFSRETLRLQLKEIFQPGKIINFTAAKKGHGEDFHAKNFGEALQRQGIPVRFLQIGDTYERVNSHFEVAPYRDIKSFSADQLAKFLAPTEKNGMTIVLNEPLNSNKLSTIIMNLSDVNLFVMDTRKTLANEITNVTTTADNNDLKNIFFILNNDGYIPSLFKEIKIVYKKLNERIQNRKNA